MVRVGGATVQWKVQGGSPEGTAVQFSTRQITTCIRDHPTFSKGGFSPNSESANFKSSFAFSVSMALAHRSFLLCLGASIGLAALPDLSVFASAPQPVDPTVYGAPSVGNAWATLLTSTNNVLGFNAFILPPFSAGWEDPVDAVTLAVAGKALPPSHTVWLPYAVQRNGSAKLTETIAVSVASEIRMVFESNVVLIRANVRARAC